MSFLHEYIENMEAPNGQQSDFYTGIFFYHEKLGGCKTVSKSVMYE